MKKKSRPSTKQRKVPARFKKGEPETLGEVAPSGLILADPMTQALERLPMMWMKTHCRSSGSPIPFEETGPAGTEGNEAPADTDQVPTFTDRDCRDSLHNFLVETFYAGQFETAIKAIPVAFWPRSALLHYSCSVRKLLKSTTARRKTDQELQQGILRHDARKAHRAIRNTALDELETSELEAFLTALRRLRAWQHLTTRYPNLCRDEDS